jgi:hypothetical protein
LLVSSHSESAFSLKNQNSKIQKSKIETADEKISFAKKSERLFTSNLLNVNQVLQPLFFLARRGQPGALRGAYLHRM